MTSRLAAAEQMVFELRYLTSHAPQDVELADQLALAEHELIALIYFQAFPRPSYKNNLDERPIASICHIFSTKFGDDPSPHADMTR